MRDQHCPDQQREDTDQQVYLRDRNCLWTQDMFLDEISVLGSVQNCFVQRADDRVLQHVHVVFPIFLPVLASAIYQEPCPTENQTDATYDKSEILLVFEVFGSKNGEISGEGRSNQGPEIGGTLPIESDPQ